MVVVEASSVAGRFVGNLFHPIDAFRVAIVERNIEFGLVPVPWVGVPAVPTEETLIPTPWKPGVAEARITKIAFFWFIRKKCA